MIHIEDVNFYDDESAIIKVSIMDVNNIALEHFEFCITIDEIRHKLNGDLDLSHLSDLITNKVFKARAMRQMYSGMKINEKETYKLNDYTLAYGDTNETS